MQSPNIVQSVPSRFLGVVSFAEQPQGEYAQQNFFISGVTRDSTGAPLGYCTVRLFFTANDSVSGRSADVEAAQTTSDANGNFSFTVQPGVSYYIVAYLAGSPDVAGATLNTLVGA